MCLVAILNLVHHVGLIGQHGGQKYIESSTRKIRELRKMIEERKLETDIEVDGGIKLNNVKKVEVLPYHTFGEYKWKELGLEYPLAGIDPPSKERIENANQILHTGVDRS